MAKVNTTKHKRVTPSVEDVKAIFRDADRVALSEIREELRGNLADALEAKHCMLAETLATHLNVVESLLRASFPTEPAARTVELGDWLTELLTQKGILNPDARPTAAELMMVVDQVIPKATEPAAEAPAATTGSRPKSYFKVRRDMGFRVNLAKITESNNE